MADLKIDEIMSSWETYFNERVKKRRDVTDLYLKYARDLLEKGMPPIFDLQHLARLVGIEPSRLRTHCGSQKMTVAAMQMADMNVWAHRS